MVPSAASSRPAQTYRGRGVLEEGAVSTRFALDPHIRARGVRAYWDTIRSVSYVCVCGGVSCHRREQRGEWI